MNFNDVHDRETAWRQLAQDLYLRLVDCQLLVKHDNVIVRPSLAALPTLPLQAELDVFEARWKELSQAAGWTLKPKGTGTDRRPASRRRRRWWWPFS